MIKLTPPQLKVLRAIEVGDSLGGSGILARSDVPARGIGKSRVINALSRMGLITCSLQTNKAQIPLVYLTCEGKNLLMDLYYDKSPRAKPYTCGAT